jgi:uncharacterized protein YyaL (SSP411 family)
MTDESGGFYSTQDADSEGKEGKFFVWKMAELMTLDGVVTNVDAVLTYWGVTPAISRKNILHISDMMGRVACGTASILSRCATM